MEIRRFCGHEITGYAGALLHDKFVLLLHQSMHSSRQERHCSELRSSILPQWDLPITFLANSQLAFIAIKIDRMTEWRWTEVFWLFWILFALFMAMMIGLVLAMLIKVVIFIVYKSNLYQGKLKFYSS